MAAISIGGVFVPRIGYAAMQGGNQADIMWLLDRLAQTNYPKTETENQQFHENDKILKKLGFDCNKTTLTNVYIITAPVKQGAEPGK